MISPLPLSPARPFRIFRVWPCTSCGYLAKSDTSSAACPNCGRVGFERSNVGSRLVPGMIQAETEGLNKDSELSGTMQQDVETFVARSPGSCTLFIPAAESSVEVIAKLSTWLGINVSVIFGGYPADLSGVTTKGYLVEAPLSIIMGETDDVSDLLNSPPTSNLEADDSLSSLPLNSHDLAGFLDSISAAIGPKVELQEEFDIKDIQAGSNDMAAPDTKPDDANSLEPLDNRYSLISKPQRFFKVGRVFMTLWSEPASSMARNGPNLSSSTVGGIIFSETRRFVVVRQGYGHALCCPIQTYQKRGTTKSRIGLENHAIVYVAGSEPKLLPDEESPGMGSFPIVIEDKSVTIDLSSRLNFSKVYTVEHNIKVRNVGKISKNSLSKLKAALVKSLGVNMSDGEAETGTESEDNVSLSTPIENQHGSSASKGSSSKNSSSTSTQRQSIFFINGTGIEREVITADLCRYLGNDALVRPGTYQDPNTRKIQHGYFITAHRPPTSAQLADLRSDSLKWQNERRSNPARARGSYDLSDTREATKQETPTPESVLRSSSQHVPSQSSVAYQDTIYGQTPPTYGQLPPLQTQRNRPIYSPGPFTSFYPPPDRGHFPSTPQSQNQPSSQLNFLNDGNMLWDPEGQ